jgi:hypothetical protein
MSDLKGTSKAHWDYSLSIPQDGRLNRRPSEALSHQEVVMMTPVLSMEAFAALGAPDLVYVRPVKASDILASVPSAQVQGFELDPDQTLYAVHRADGERLAVLTDRASAVAAALAHELAPVSVH